MQGLKAWAEEGGGVEEDAARVPLPKGLRQGQVGAEGGSGHQKKNAVVKGEKPLAGPF